MPTIFALLALIVKVKKLVGVIPTGLWSVSFGQAASPLMGNQCGSAPLISPLTIKADFAFACLINLPKFLANDRLNCGNKLSTNAPTS